MAEFTLTPQEPDYSPVVAEISHGHRLVMTPMGLGWTFEIIRPMGNNERMTLTDDEAQVALHLFMDAVG